jgi:Phospholipase_D-nuclease N-terminal
VLFFDGVAGLAVLALWLFCVLDVITSDEASIRNLPKMAWVFIVIFLFEIGAIAWLIAGRPQAARRSLPYKGNTGIPPEYDRPGRAAAQHPDDDAAFLTQLRARAEAQRKTAAEQAKLLRDQEDQPPRS